MKKGVLVLLLTIVSVNLIAQKIALPDDSISMFIATKNDSNSFEPFLYYQLNEFQHYRPIGKDKLPMARAGNIGLVSHSYQFNKQDWGIDLLMGGYRPYLMSKGRMRYYKMSRPFTSLRYTNGSEEEQLFQLFHSQNLGEGLNVSFEYQRTVSTGYYQRQLTSHTQFNATFNLRSRNHRFYSSGYYLINGMKSTENGGVVVVSNDTLDTPFLLGVNLGRSQNRGRTQSVGTENRYNLFRKDTGKVLVNLSHEFDWHKAYRNFESTIGNETFYSNFFLDSIATADSSFAQNVSNTVKLNFINDQFYVGIKNEQYHYFQNFLIDTRFASNYLLAAANLELFDRSIQLQFEKGLDGYFRDEIEIHAQAEIGNWKGYETSIIAQMSEKQPDYFLANQRANNTFFNRELTTSGHQSLSILTSSEEQMLKAKIGFRILDNYVYFDSLQITQQFKDDISSFFVEFEKDFHFLNHLVLRNAIQFQSISNRSFVPLPELYSFHSLFYENDFFNESLRIQFGVDAYYIGAYDGYQYSPASAQFFLTQSDSRELGSILQLDAFLNMGINKSARIFVKMENVTSSSFSETTNRILNNPIPGRSMKVGFSWRMLN